MKTNAEAIERCDTLENMGIRASVAAVLLVGCGVPEIPAKDPASEPASTVAPGAPSHEQRAAAPPGRKTLQWWAKTETVDWARITDERTALGTVAKDWACRVEATTRGVGNLAGHAVAEETRSLLCMRPETTTFAVTALTCTEAEFNGMPNMEIRQITVGDGASMGTVQLRCDYAKP